MEIGLNNYIKRVASDLFIKYNSEERRRIDISIKNIISRLNEYFDDQINKCIVFGSYSRDTILPRTFDIKSDIDILIQFNTNDYEKLKPESYRNQLKKFAQLNYQNSVVVKDHPSIVLQLNHINFDLVPCIYDKGFFYNSIEIPDKEGYWMETQPDDFNKKLTEANTRYNSVVKPIVRLLKYWNASHGYPYYSYTLETYISEMNFKNDNYESGLLYAIQELSAYNLSNRACDQIDALKSNGKKVREYLGLGEHTKAKKSIDRILPGCY